MIEKGGKAPNFGLPENENKWKTLHDIPGSKIVFFFPKAFTPGCTKQSCSLQSNYSDLKKRRHNRSNWNFP